MIPYFSYMPRNYSDLDITKTLLFVFASLSVALISYLYYLLQSSASLNTLVVFPKGAPLPTEERELIQVENLPEEYRNLFNAIIAGITMKTLEGCANIADVYREIIKAIMLDSIRENLETAVKHNLTIICRKSTNPGTEFTSYYSHVNQEVIINDHTTADYLGHEVEHFVSHLRHMQGLCKMVAQWMTFPIYMQTVLKEDGMIYIDPIKVIALNRTLNIGDDRVKEFRNMWTTTQQSTDLSPLNATQKIKFSRYLQAAKGVIPNIMANPSMSEYYLHFLKNAGWKPNNLNSLFPDISLNKTAFHIISMKRKNDGTIAMILQYASPVESMINLDLHIQRGLELYQHLHPFEQVKERKALTFQTLSLEAIGVFYRETQLSMLEDIRKCPYPQLGYHYSP